MRAEYSSVNLIKQDSSGWCVYEDFATRQRYRRCETGVTNYEDSASQELLPGGEVREVVTGIMQIQKFWKSLNCAQPPVNQFKTVEKILLLSKLS